MEIFTFDSPELEELLQKVYQQGREDTRKALSDKNELDESAPMTAKEFSETYTIGIDTVLDRIKARKIPLIKARPVTFQRKYREEILKRKPWI